MKIRATRPLLIVMLAATPLFAAIACSSSSDGTGVVPDAGDADTSDVGSPVEAATEAGPYGCSPVLEEGWVPPAWVAPETPTSPCTVQEVTDYTTACIDDAPTSAACNTFLDEPNASACANCMRPTQASHATGAVLALDNGIQLANIAACIAAIDGDYSATGCAAKLTTYQQCQTAACIDRCPIDYSSTDATNTTTLAFDTCYSNASNACKAFSTGVICTKDAKYRDCYANNFDDQMHVVGNRICAAGGDAGTITDAGTADAADD
ncbi:MAG TPA: hypothetical protein VF407_13550 [Polyangiaceae bacterium]